MTDLFNPPPDLTSTQWRVLADLERGPLFRVRDGWRARGEARTVRLDTAAPLTRAAWARVTIVKGHSALVITPDGRDALRHKERKRA